ncbi:2-iminobutanoate/2-iminopropanoate deaminase [Salisediminibacterium halotolerans]|nr:2-iminobutanoate/2-iminopropanoate deaminase [Actinophytocola xinjiangensis]RPE89727.1 2-iminobutanoate/2-iminopropanoate deaminase [Salisediminibacterium halotolerans]TWG32563.1 2-iminobutanoate/2-iminopropanoate deaminase [Salisediminibacterium halotolerans]GEL09191.1 reactive intermediate/imine deaminase [Salisediminibacterium halotolerans]
MMSNKTPIQTNDAPDAIGPYSQAVITEGVVYTSGQIGLDPETMTMQDSVEDQAHQVMQNVKAVLKEAGCDMNDVIKAMIFLKDMDDFHHVNDIYASYFKEPYPARSAVAVAQLPKDARVEVEVIAKQS